MAATLAIYIFSLGMLGSECAHVWPRLTPCAVVWHLQEAGGDAPAMPGATTYQMYCLDESVRPTAALSMFAANSTSYLMCHMFIGGITLTAQRAAIVQTTRPHVDDGVACISRNERKLAGVGGSRSWVSRAVDGM
jgi:hypothetical protein